MVPVRYHLGMSTQIAVRLPDDLVDLVDRMVAEGAASRAAVVADALREVDRRRRAEHDARVYEATGDYDDLVGLAAHASFDD